MEKKSYKKQIIIVIVLLVLISIFAGLAFYMQKRSQKNNGPTLEQKVEIMKKLNEDSKKIPDLPTEQKQKIIDGMIKSLDSQKTTVPENPPVVKNR